MSLYISTDTPESTNDLLEILSPRITLKKIQRILNNRHSHAAQIKAIKKLLKGEEANT